MSNGLTRVLTPNYSFISVAEIGPANDLVRDANWDRLDSILPGLLAGVEGGGSEGAVVSFSDAETPEDSGDHQHFTLAHAPSPGASLVLVLNGLIQEEGASDDYTLSGNSITLASPQSGAFTLLAWYRYAGAGTSFADAETPVDSGDHQHFTLAYAPNPPASLILILNGLVQEEGASDDYTLSGDSITLANAQSGSFTLLAWYRY